MLCEGTKAVPENDEKSIRHEKKATILHAKLDMAFSSALIRMLAPSSK